MPCPAQGKWLVLIPHATAAKCYTTALLLGALGSVPLLLLAPVPLLLSILSQLLTLAGAFAAAMGASFVPAALSPALPMPYLAHPWPALGAFSALALAGALVGAGLGHGVLAAYLGLRYVPGYVAGPRAAEVAGWPVLLFLFTDLQEMHLSLPLSAIWERERTLPERLNPEASNPTA